MIISDFKVLERILRPLRIYNIYHFKPLKGFSLDSRSIIAGQAFVAVKGGHHDGHSFIKKAIAKGAGLIIAEKYIAVKPKVPFFIVEDSYQALKSISAYIRRKKNPLVFAVTGSLGKTTTKEMLSSILTPDYTVLKNKGTENNLLGVAKTCFSLRDEAVMILELGTNSPGEIRSLAEIAAPDIGIITLIKPVHLEGLGSLKGVFKEKVSLLKVNPGMKAVLNRDDPYLSKISRANRIYWFGRDKSNHLFARPCGNRRDGFSFLIQGKYELQLPFYRQGVITNVLAALLAARMLGLPLKVLVERIREFKDFLPLRMQIQEYRGFSILNDAYNASPYSMQVAFRSLKKCPLKKIVVIGDMLELGKKSRYYHELLAGQIKRAGFDYCLSLGEHSRALDRKLRGSGYRNSFHFSSHKAVAQFINKKIGRNLRDKKRYLIFLKGSRKMELEKITPYLR